MIDTSILFLSWWAVKGEFSGRYGCGLVFAYEGKVPPSGSGGTSMPENMSAWLIRRGHVDIDSPGLKRLRVGPGFWAIPRIGMPRVQNFSPDAEILSICFRAEQAIGGQAFRMDRNLSIPSKGRPELESLGVDLVRAAKGLLDYAVNPEAKGVESLPDMIRIQACFWKWFEALFKTFSEEGVALREPVELDSRIKAMAAFLETQAFGGPVPYESLERLGGLGRVQIDRLFLRDTGMTPRGFMERKAMALAREQLLRGSLTVKELAGKLGFASSAHFCAWFKRNSGQRPSEYRTSPR